MSIELPLFPLRTVLYPGGLLPLRIFEPRYVGLVRDCMRDGHGFGVTPILRGAEAGKPAEPHALGTLAEIVDFDQGQDGLLHILCRGGYRFHLLAHAVTREGLLRGQIEPFEDEAATPLPERNRHLKVILEKVLELESASTGQAFAVPTDSTDIIYRLMERLPFPWPVKLEVLATTSTAKQLEICSFALDQLLQKKAD